MRKRKRSCCFLAVLLMVPLLFAPVHAQQQGELLVDCDRIEGWSSPGGQYGTKLSLSSMKREGSGSLQVEFLGRGQTPFQGFAFYTFEHPVDLSGYSGMAMDVYIGGRDLTSVPSQFLQVNFLKDQTAGEGFNHNNIDLGVTASEPYSGMGWRTVTFSFEEEAQKGFPTSWKEIGCIRFGYMNYGENTQGVHFLFDNIRLTGKKDDGHAGGSFSDRLDSAVTLHDGETMAGLSNRWGAAVSLSDKRKTQGQSSICMAAPDGAAEGSVQGGFLLTFARPANLSNYSYFEFDYYLQETTQGPQALMVSLATEGVDGFNFLVTLEEAEVGWNHLILPLSGRDPVCEADLARINTIRVAWLNYAKAPKREFWFDHFYVCGIVDKSLPSPEIVLGGPEDDAVLFLDCDSLLGWQAIEGEEVQLSIDPQKQQGAASIRADFCDASQDSVFGGRIFVAFEKLVDLSNYTDLEFYLYVGRAAPSQTAVELTFSSASGLQVSGSHEIPAVYQGWRKASVSFDAFPDGSLNSVTQIDIVFVNHGQLDSQYFLFDAFSLSGCKDASLPLPEVILRPSGQGDNNPSEGTKWNYGDVDGSGEMDACDALWILQHSVGLQRLTGQQLKAADVNHDGLVDSEDALLVLRYIVGLEKSFD